MGIFLGDVLVVEDNFKLLTLSIKIKVQLVSARSSLPGERSTSPRVC